MPKLSPISYKELVRVFEADGFRCVRTEGDHLVFTKPGVIRPVVHMLAALLAGNPCCASILARASGIWLLRPIRPGRLRSRLCLRGSRAVLPVRRGAI